MPDVRLLNFPKIQDPRGNLTFLENFKPIPFEIERVFWTYEVPGGEGRGGHSYKSQDEVIIALSGSFDVIVTDRDGNETRWQLNRSYVGLHLPPKTWRRLENFSTNAVSLHLSSQAYSPDEYIRDFDDYANGK